MTHGPIVLPEIVTEQFKNQWVANLPIEDYHKDKSAVSSTGLKNAVESAYNFHYCWVNEYEKKDTASLRFGTAAHCAILEPMEFDRRFVAMPDFGDMRSGTNRVKRDSWKNTLKPDAIIMEEKEIETLKRGIDRLLCNRVAVNLIKGAAFEQSAYFRDPVTGLKCRFRPDAIRQDLSVMIDLKACRHVSNRAFAAQIWEYRYDIQMAFYEYGIRVLHGRGPDTVAFIVVQNQKPFDVAVHEVGPMMMERGQIAVQKMLARIEKGVTTGKWPGVQEEAQIIEMPHYTSFIED